jgi:hypothetical protein
MNYKLLLGIFLERGSSFLAARCRAVRQSAGVFTLNNSQTREPRTRKSLAPTATASFFRENSLLAICRSTMGNTLQGNSNGKPGLPSTLTKAARFWRCQQSTTLSSNSTDTNGISQASMISAGSRLVFNAVYTPPRGPQRGTKSFRTRRTLNPSLLASRRTCPSKVRLPRRSRDLSLPMRVLKPPARMQTPQALRTFGLTMGFSEPCPRPSVRRE